ncbi:ATP-dependent Clp protease proteolytic subunit 3, chloroplastic [Tanacetum coccineum]
MSTILSESALEKALQAALELLKKAAQVLLKKAAEALKRHAGALARKLWMHEGMGIYAAMKQRKADISTICVGLAASMDAFLLACGNRHEYYMNQRKGVSQGQVSKIISRVSGTPLREDYDTVHPKHPCVGLEESLGGSRMDALNGRIGGEDGDGQKTEEAASA